MIVKVCGMRDAVNIRAIEAAGADMTGLVFCKESPRYVGMINSRSGLIPDFPDKSLADGQRAGECKPFVGVFSDDMPQNIITRIYNYGLDWVQLNGEESAVMIDNLRRTVDPDIRPGLKVIKRVVIGCRDDFAMCAEYEGHADMFLFDISGNGDATDGCRTDWGLLEAYAGATPFLVGGDIGPEDAASLREIVHPMFAGVDIDARFETAPAMKDVALVEKFIASLKR